MAEFPLPLGTILNSQSYKYKVKKILGQGSFGIAYLATMYYQTIIDGVLVEQQKDVALKEFFMKGINEREGSTVTQRSCMFSNYKDKFIHEAKNLRFMVHPHVIQVYDFFEENETVYYSMEYLPNGSLNDKIEKNGRLTEKEALCYAREIGLALSYMHDYKMVHLDLKPSNVMINDDEEAVLIDFGLSKQYDDSGKPETSTDVGKGTPGYAPIEQVNFQDGKDFPATMDVYALGATLFKMLTGHRPPEASSILNDGFPAYELQEAGVNDNLISVIAKALNPIKKDRIQTIDDFLKLLSPIVDKEKANYLARKGWDMYDEGKFGKALEYFKHSFSEDGTQDSLAYTIAEMYEDGKGVEADKVKATSWYLCAAKLGHPKAQADIGEIFSQGDYVPVNNAVALKWLRMAAINGYSRARIELAQMYYEGQGCPKDYVEAARWYGKVLEKEPNNEVANFFLGWMYESGQGIQQDYLKASQLYKRVADSNQSDKILCPTLETVIRIPDCMFRLGYLYQFGLGVQLDLKNAIKYYKNAARYDFAPAIFNLGCMYYDGQGVDECHEQAVELWTKAANVKIYDGDDITEGGLSAMYNLGACYEYGDGCNKDYSIAMEWYTKALKFKHIKAQSAIESLKIKIESEHSSRGIWRRIKKALS